MKKWPRGKSVVYRRVKFSPIWWLIEDICLKRGIKPNQLIDQLVMTEHVKEFPNGIGGNSREL
jgi:hypothetical protein